MTRMGLLIPGCFLLLSGCVDVPDGIRPVRDFDVRRYLGTWYEIARLDHGFERGLSHVSATYALRDDGGIDVLNRGFDREEGRWKEARGRAYFVGEKTTASLKVSFFGPFFGGYHVIALDRAGYDYAMVCGPSRSYLWILSRRQTLGRPVLDSLLKQAEELGFATGGLIFVEHRRPEVSGERTSSVTDMSGTSMTVVHTRGIPLS